MGDVSTISHLQSHTIYLFSSLIRIFLPLILIQFMTMAYMHLVHSNPLSRTGCEHCTGVLFIKGGLENFTTFTACISFCSFFFQIPSFKELNLYLWTVLDRSALLHSENAMSFLPCRHWLWSSLLIFHPGIMVLYFKFLFHWKVFVNHDSFLNGASKWHMIIHLG